MIQENCQNNFTISFFRLVFLADLVVLFWFHLLAKLAWKESRRNNLLKLTKPLLKEYSPLKTKVYDEEYLITDGITQIGSVGGTLGLFIGASNSSAMYSIMDFLKSSIVSHFSRK